MYINTSLVRENDLDSILKQLNQHGFRFPIVTEFCNESNAAQV